ncbi:unnamed protein product [Aspergillus oryzae var. brunneus]|uniref:Unnamed protein product n=1 Tax=Aspergillus oryzae var. brunneus TaxID=332754 RepID=A0ABQ6KB72_ASPOZ|nr:unnamed protein product [Aspergillus oryzae var. brunneus]
MPTRLPRSAEVVTSPMTPAPIGGDGCWASRESSRGDEGSEILFFEDTGTLATSGDLRSLGWPIFTRWDMLFAKGIKVRTEELSSGRDKTVTN